MIKLLISRAARFDREAMKATNKTLTLGAPQRPQYGLVSESVLATLHHKSEPVVNALMGLLLLREGSKRCESERHSEDDWE